MATLAALSALVTVAITAGPVVAAEPADGGYHLDRFERVQLTDVYYSEGANHGDIDGDGVQDIVHGPFWFAGPDYKRRHELYPPLAQNREAYSDNFFSWVHDFDADGRPDVLTVGFPGTPAYVYRNPGPDGWSKHWPKHEVLDWVSNESPQFVDLVGGDGRPELVCTRDGHFGYASWSADQPLGKWTFHPISPSVATKRFGHGLGIGDIDGDGRPDVLSKDGWFQQPASLVGDPEWKFHPFTFTRAGGAEMYVYDVDGDGDGDVITSLAAHEFGLAWFEQLREGDQITFRRHLIMGGKPAENRYGVVFSELHSVNLADIDGDGLKDIVTGKTFWSHHRQSPMWDAGAVVYWFKLVRGEDGVDWLPFQADGEAGIGRQLVVGDLNGDALPDLVVGGMKGAHVLIHRREAVDRQRWEQAQPRRYQPIAAGLEPAQAARAMTAPAGFQVQLAAGEPQVHQPIAMAFDDRGRLWVAEAYTYPRRAPEGEGRDRIVILEDTDRDGSLDHRTVFIEGLNLVSGLEVGFGGVWVGAAPYLLFIPDQDGDDRPDGEPQVLLDGFGYQDTHETLNAFIWGPDGWLYGCHGVFTHSRVGKPGTPDAERVPLNAGVWRYHPVRHEFDVFARGTSNPWGVDFNDHGQAFITACVIPHLWHIVQGARYQRQGGQHFNPYLYDDIKTIADHSHYVGNIRDHAWWGHEPHAPTSTLQAGGGHAHCGAMIYLGDNWPELYRNQIFMNNIHGNRVNQDLLVRRGSGYVGQHGPDLLVANDRWFRGINLRYGPDGAVYLIDWYDENACHRTNPEIWDRTNGRVYRIAYGEPEIPQVALGTLGDLQLVELQQHRNDWYVRMARRLLQERAASRELDAAALVALERLVDGASDERRQLRAIWTLHAVGRLTPERLRKLRQSASEFVRGWAIQLELERGGELEAASLAQLERLAEEDPSPLVRLYLASALQKLPPQSRWTLAGNLLAHAEDAEDHNLPLMYWYGIEPLVAEDVDRAMQLALSSRVPLVQQFLMRRAAAEPKSLEAVAELLVRSPSDAIRGLALREMLGAFQGRVKITPPRAWKEAYELLLASDSDELRELADRVAVALGDQRIFPKLRQQVVAAELPMAARRQALEILVAGRDPLAAETFQQAVAVPGLRAAALKALASYDHPRTPAVILAGYATFSEAERRDAVATLVSRPSYALAILDAIEAGAVPRTDLHAYHVRQLLRFDNDQIAARLKSTWGEIRETAADKRQKIDRWKQVLTADTLAHANLGKGRLLFAKTCANCHRLFGEGGQIGPDITGSNRANLDYLLENVVDPSAVLGKDYRLTILGLVDGRVVSGIVVKETESALTVQTINDRLVVPLEEIEQRRLSTQSMMPESLLDNLAEADVRDLVAYLGSSRQVPLQGPQAPIDPRTGKVSGAAEGESLKILEKTRGQARSQPMGGFPKDRWSASDQLFWTGGQPGDRLVLEVETATAGDYELEVVMTRARDYGIVQLTLDGRRLGGPIDLFHAPDVITTGVFSLSAGPLEAGPHRLGIEILGANPEAVKSYMFGLDYVRLVSRQ